MIKSRFFAAFALAILLAAPAIPVHAATEFKVPKIAEVHSILDASITKRISRIPRLTLDEKTMIVSAVASLNRSFVNLDAHFSSTDPLRPQAIRQLVRSYSNLSKLLKRISASKGVSSAVSATLTDTVQAGAKSAGTEADILYYADDFEGRGTAMGDRFSQEVFSAARCGTELWKFIQVSANGKSVVVKANDRPNCQKHPDIVDLSKVAFSTLSPLSAGRLKGGFLELGRSPSGYRKEFVPTDAFSSLWISVSEKTPNTYLMGETFRISGKVNDGKTDTVLFLKKPSGDKYSRSNPVAADGSFFYELPLLESGRHELVIASGMGFTTSRTYPIYVLENSSLEGRALIGSDSSPYSIRDAEFRRSESSDLTPIIVFDLPESREKLLKTVRISQEGKDTLVRTTMGDAAFFVEETNRFDPNVPVKVTVTSSLTETEFSMDAHTAERKVYDAEMTLAPAYKTERKEPIDAFVDGSMLKVKATSLTGRDPLRAEAYLTLPNGNVKVLKFPTDSAGSDGYLKRDVEAVLSENLVDKGQYLIEVMYSNGFPAYNGPIVFGTKVAAILPNEYDSAGKHAESGVHSAETDGLRFINAIRNRAGLNALSIDENLKKLAEFKAKDMADHNYVGHDDSHGQKIGLTAKRAGISLTGSLGENVAGGSVGFDYLLAGLSLSGGHRANMLGDWKKIGIAAVIKDGLTYYVQVFGD